MSQEVFARDLKLEPYWYDGAAAPELARAQLPASVDVAVVGAGYTGLSAALTLARAGRSVAVLEAGGIGAGASSRNGGQCGITLKPGFDGLSRRYGKPRAISMYKEALNALDYLQHLVERERIACDLSTPGRFVGAHRPAHYESLARSYQTLRREVGLDCHTIPRSEQSSEIATDAYHGGGVQLNFMSLHPARYHLGLLQRVIDRGVIVSLQTPVSAIERERTGFSVIGPGVCIRAREVFVATNGYANVTKGLPYFRRRVIPIGSYLIATEPLGPGTLQSLLPGKRCVVDTRKVVHFYRTSPDGERLIFGGRVAAAEIDLRRSGRLLCNRMIGIFPQLSEVKVSHSWMGFVGYTFDHLPHIGRHEGVHFAMGYCGSGVAMGTYLGHKAALKILASPGGPTAFDDLPFQSRPLYDGKPWFLTGAMLFYRAWDRLV